MFNRMIRLQPTSIGLMVTALLAAGAVGCQHERAVSRDSDQANAGEPEMRGSAMSQGAEGKQPWKHFTKPSQEKLKQELTSMQFNVTQREGTEPPFHNEYWNNKAAGIYVDIVSGEPLFSSTDKFESGTGWPSFVKPIEPDVITLRGDSKLLEQRTEVRSKIADSHLGHVFDDGPPERGGKRYCLDSAALRFVPKDQMKAQGYGYLLSTITVTPEK